MEEIEDGVFENRVEKRKGCDRKAEGNSRGMKERNTGKPIRESSLPRSKIVSIPFRLQKPST